MIKKIQSVMDGRTDGRTDNAKIVYPTTNKFCGGGDGGIKMILLSSPENETKGSCTF